MYGRIQVDGKVAYAHRVSYQTFVGPIPAGMQIDHLCRYPRCFNPRHLQAVTPSMNVRRSTSPGARARRREHCLNGHPYSEFGRMVAGRRICHLCRKATFERYTLRRIEDLNQRARRAS